MSAKYTLNKEDLKKIGTALLFSVLSAVVSSLIVIVGNLDLGSYAFLIPTINTFLYGMKKYTEGKAL